MKKTFPFLPLAGLVVSLVIITLLVAVFLRMSSIEKQLTLQHVEFDHAREDRTRLVDLNEKIYRTVITSLQSRDSIQQEIARSLVIAMNDDPVRSQLLNVMNESPLTVASVKRRINHVMTIESTFEFEEQQVPVIRKTRPVDEWEKWNYDIFYLEDHPADSSASEMVAQRLVNSGCSGRIRVRMLPYTVNMRDGYHVGVSEVRYNTRERQGAEAVNRLINGAIDTDSPRFSLRQIAMNTPNYISIFVVR